MRLKWMSPILICLLISTACRMPEVPPSPTVEPTPTPEPTETPVPSPTPVPIDVSLTIQDADGSPIAGAQVTAADGNTAQTDDSGLVMWNGLPEEPLDLTVDAQGYDAASETLTLERGPNEAAIQLARNELEPLPADVCAPNETLLYLEDFQDQVAEEWPEFQFGAPGWSMGPSVENPDNIVLIANADPGQIGNVWAMMGNTPIRVENTVWRARFNMAGTGTMSFNWRFATEPFQLNGEQIVDSRYQVITGTQGNEQMRLIQGPVLNVEVARGFVYPQSGTWHDVQIATYDRHTEVWLDDQMMMAYDPPENVDMIPTGTIGLEYWPVSADTFVYFDDIALCDLSEPFVPLLPLGEETGS